MDDELTWGHVRQTVLLQGKVPGDWCGRFRGRLFLTFLEEMRPLFYNEPVLQHMKEYLAQQQQQAHAQQKKLVGALSAQKIVLYAPQLKLFLNHGLKITPVHRPIAYVPQKDVRWFVKKVTENRRKGDQKFQLALLAEVFKLLGNSVYGKLIEALERQMSVKYAKNVSVLRKEPRSVWFQDFEETGDVYEIETRKREMDIDRPFQVGKAVHQMAKLRILQLYYDCLEMFLDRRDFELVQMDTDSLYLRYRMILWKKWCVWSCGTSFKHAEKGWFTWDKWSVREPGLVKLEFKGTRMIALCSIRYYGEGDNETGKVN